MANEYYDEKRYAVDYEDERFDKVTAAEEEALAKNDQLFAERENTVANLYDKQAEQVQQWADTQSQLQQEQTDFTIEQINQQKDQAHKDYLKEQSGAYVDWRKQSNEYGTEAEKMASAGLINTGYSESSQVAMYNQYQNRIATARESYNQAVLNYNNAIKDARLQNNSVLAEIAATAMEKSLELTIQGAIYKDNLLAQKADRELQLKQFYSNEYQKVLDQINTENAMRFEADQNAINREWQSAEKELDRQFEAAQAEIDRQWKEAQAELDRQFELDKIEAQTEADIKKLEKQHELELAELAKEAEYAKAQLAQQLENEKALAKYKYQLEYGYTGGVYTGASNSYTPYSQYIKSGIINKTSGSSSGSSSSSSSSSGSMSKETAQSILALGGPYSATTVANKVANGTVKATTSKNGNLVFKQNVKLPTWTLK